MYISYVFFTTWNELFFSPPANIMSIFGDHVSRFCFVDLWKQTVSEVLRFFPFPIKRTERKILITQICDEFVKFNLFF